MSSAAPVVLRIFRRNAKGPGVREISQQERRLPEQPPRRFLLTASNQFPDLPFDSFLVKPYYLFRHCLLSPFCMVCRGFILTEFCKPCLFYKTYSTLLSILLRLICNLSESLDSSAEICYSMPN